ncbi:hypothetical protein [Sphingomonas sp. BK235]|uniref:hypothetical protein n=1 Tax=Sphingomonas sp. BK235 TaxID=2512131 RepID=UPI0010D98F61|nr:hypothetical protein [Sphingomonas sp. BK235]TCP35561.1 hypothetical protein EV292_102147 [Sphingomonas sp. BK235]
MTDSRQPDHAAAPLTEPERDRDAPTDPSLDQLPDSEPEDNPDDLTVQGAE